MPPEERWEGDGLLVLRSMNRSFLSNTWLVADRPGGTAVLVDTGGPAEPVLDAIERYGLHLTHVFCTHRHSDHISGNGLFRSRFSAEICCHAEEAKAIGDIQRELRDGEILETGGLQVEVLHLPGHTVGQAAFAVNRERVFTGDTLFRRSIGGTRAPGHAAFEDLRRSIMERLMKLPRDWQVHPGHTDSTTVGEEWERNPFIRLFRGLDAAGDRSCMAFGEPARLILRAEDYDGGTKCWVRFERTGNDEIVPGSSVIPS